MCRNEPPGEVHLDAINFKSLLGTKPYQHVVLCSNELSAAAAGSRGTEVLSCAVVLNDTSFCYGMHTVCIFRYVCYTLQKPDTCSTLCPRTMKTSFLHSDVVYGNGRT